MQHPSNRGQAPVTSNGQNEELLQPISQDSAKEDETAITLYGFRPRFGVPSVRPFDMKPEVQLQMMGPKYRKISANMTVHRKADSITSTTTALSPLTPPSFGSFSKKNTQKILTMALATPNEQAHRLQSNLLKITSIGPRSTLAGPWMANFKK